MSDSSNLPAPAAGSALAAPSETPYLDANGFDPAQYDWVPVKRKRRVDGWSNEKQRAFIEALADCGSVASAAREVNMSVHSCYRLRRSPGAEAFAVAWEAAIQQAAHALVDAAFERAFNGSEEPVFDREGRRVGRRMRQNDRLLMFLLRAHLPEQYAHAHRDARPVDARLPARPAPVAAALTALDPVTPADPQRLMPPAELDVAIQVADIMDGQLPSWRRDRSMDPDPEPVAAAPDEAFERALEEAKRVANPVAAAVEDALAAEREEEEAAAREDWDETPRRRRRKTRSRPNLS
jgi:hypothetical protein